MFILFPQESSILFNLPINQIIHSSVFFSGGMVLGKCLSIFNLHHFYSMLTNLIIVVIINSLFIMNLVFHFNIYFFRFILGICIGFIITIFMKEISFRHKEYKENEKFYSILLNYHIISVPLYFVFKWLIPINGWLFFINIILIINIVYVLKAKDNFKYKSDNIVVQFPKDFIKKYLYKYVFLGTILSLILFIALLVLFLQHKILTIYDKDQAYIFLESLLGKHIGIFYNQIPLLIGSICYFMRKKLQVYISYMIFSLLLINFFFLKSVTLLSIINGLLYGMYIIYAPFFTSYIKFFTKDFKQSQLFFYGLKSLLSFMIQSYFLTKAFDFVKNEKNYMIVVFVTYIFIKVMLVIFNKIKINIKTPNKE